MKIGIMQPYFLPYLGYWQLIAAVDKYVIADDYNFIKSGWIARNRILLAGEPHYIKLSLVKASQNKWINEIEINHSDENRNQLLKTLQRAYSKAPYYSETMEVLNEIIDTDIPNLAEYLNYSIQCVCRHLDIDTEIIMSSSVEKDNELRKQYKIFEICHKLGGTEYYNAIGGTELYDFDEFAAEGLTLSFVQTHDICYEQYGNEFVPDLSIADVLMFNGKSKTKELLKAFSLVTK